MASGGPAIRHLQREHGIAARIGELARLGDSLRTAGKVDRDGRSLADNALVLELAAVLLDERARHDDAEPGATFARRVVRAFDSLENVVRHPGTLVDHLDGAAPAAAGVAHVDRHL